MKISIDGLRRSLGAAYSRTALAFQAMKIAETHWDKDSAVEDLKEGLNDLRCMIGGPYVCLFRKSG